MFKLPTCRACGKELDEHALDWDAAGYAVAGSFRTPDEFVICRHAGPGLGAGAARKGTNMNVPSPHCTGCGKAAPMPFEMAWPIRGGRPSPGTLERTPVLCPDCLAAGVRFPAALEARLAASDRSADVTNYLAPDGSIVAGGPDFGPLPGSVGDGR